MTTRFDRINDRDGQTDRHTQTLHNGIGRDAVQQLQSSLTWRIFSRFSKFAS